MKITIAIENPDGTRSNERQFDRSAVVIGRDSLECDIPFDKSIYPMISRRHAELRFRDGRWLISDLQSRYGTVVNEQPVGGEMPVIEGSRIRVGTSGPVLRIVLIEAPQVQQAPIPQ